MRWAGYEQRHIRADLPRVREEIELAPVDRVDADDEGERRLPGQQGQGVVDVAQKR